MFGVAEGEGAFEAVGRHAYHRVRGGVQGENSANHMGIRSEFIGPQTVTYYCDIVAARLGILAGQEEASRSRTQSEDFKIVCADHLSENLPGFRATTPGQWKGTNKASNAVENLAFSGVILEIRIRHGEFRGICRSH